MKKQLLTVGDSFTYGDELDDHYRAWPYRLADLLGWEVHNMGRSGSGNSGIIRRCIEELSTTHYDLVIIGWTSPGRIEWKDDIGAEYNLWPGYPTTTEFFEHHPWRVDLLNFINQYHNSSYLYQQYLIQVISLQSYFKVNNINYKMIDVRQKDYYRLVGKEMHNTLEKQVDTDNFIGWEKFGMIELTASFPKGKGGHPLELGHERIANEFKKYIRD